MLPDQGQNKQMDHNFYKCGKTQVEVTYNTFAIKNDNS